MHFICFHSPPGLANWNLEQNFSLVSISDSSAIITSQVFHLFNLWRRRKVPRQKVVWNKKFTCVSGKIIDPEKNSKTFYFSPPSTIQNKSTWLGTPWQEFLTLFCSEIPRLMKMKLFAKYQTNYANSPKPKEENSIF